ncbi:hypothetical protein PU629_15305 [Pullulanibacillus sp. KACC 23026]|uniref:hypothetical protein n=1 Tax=Pullulanibacillus sp. KACC 23026 TaxID=3028315 RepID=UPI0023B17A2E|nr:hypothetical protein [Pullulanibacillus sp. KACC 23026]WEG11515.1 hypothetical protein PU629_15305 [Pullulanibacillus sp. KACC 23026]
MDTKNPVSLYKNKIFEILLNFYSGEQIREISVQDAVELMKIQLMGAIQAIEEEKLK